MRLDYVNLDGTLNKRSVMRRAHDDYRFWSLTDTPRTFSECLRTAWQVARLARTQIGRQPKHRRVNRRWRPMRRVAPPGGGALALAAA